MSRLKNGGLCLFVLTVLAMLVAVPAMAKEPISANARVIIQLDEPPLAQFEGAVGEARTLGGHLDVDAAASREYLEMLRQRQDEFVAELGNLLPTARVQQRYRISFNGMAAVVPRESMKQVRAMPGVKAVTETYRLEQELDASPELIDLATLWAALPGGYPAGAGRRFALLDSGVNAAHPFFDDTGFTAPSGFPKSYRFDSGVMTDLDLPTYTNNKVIVASVYVEPGDTSAEYGFPYGAGSDHGTHVAGIGAGVEGDYAYQGTPVHFSGMAPGAFIMSYRMTGDVAEYLSAVEDVIADQADVLNVSQGHSRWLTTDAEHDPYKQALEAAVDAGVIVVCSAGNAGTNGEGSITGAWKYSEKLITVAASTHDRVFQIQVSTTAQGGPQELPGNSGSGSPAITAAITRTVGIAPGGTAGTNAGFACNAAPPAPGSMTDQICFVSRGSCTFAEKQANCAAAGAVAMLLHNNTTGTVIMGSLADTIPAVSILQADGVSLLTWYEANPMDTETTLTTPQRLTTAAPDVMASFSSQGPTGIRTIKPDVTAPGVNILSSVVDGNDGTVTSSLFDTYGGTSMSTPHVSGLALLARELHPTWTPAQIKSAIMNTAETDVYLDAAHTVEALAKHRGAGRVDAGALVAPSLTFAPPSVTFGQVDIGDLGTVPVQVTDTRTSGAAIPWTVSVDERVDDANVVVSPSSTAFTTLPGQSASFNVNLSTTGAPTGDFEGFINVTDGSEDFNLPYWVRIYDPTAAKDVLLIDWDLSPTPGFGDYRTAYTNALDTLGVTYDVFPGGSSTAANGNVGPTLAELQAYPTVIMFMGDNYLNWSQRHTGGSFPIQDYLVGGGNLLLIGQDFASYAAYDQNIGRDFNFTSMAGWMVEDSDFYPVTTGMEVLTTELDFFGEAADISYNSGGTGLDNQLFPDSGRTVIPEDEVDFYLYNARNIAAHARVLASYTTTEMDGVPVTLTETAAATGVAPDPTLENEVARVSWRAAMVHFGIEGLNGNLGAVAIDDALGKLLDFVNDDVTASLAMTGFGANRGFTCNAASAVGSEFSSYRWDFGDGSAIVETTGNTTTHTYWSNGAFTARCQPVTELTRSTVASAGFVVACPTITVTPATLADGFIGVSYSQSVAGAGGVAPYSFALDSGSTLPDGLQLNQSTGEIYGTPTTAAVSTFDVVATDDNGCTGASTISLTVVANVIFEDGFESGDVSAWSTTVP